MNNKGMAGQTNNTNLVIGAVVVLIVLVVIGFMVFGMNRQTPATSVDTTADEQAALMNETPLTATVSASPLVSPSPSSTTAAMTESTKEFSVVATNFKFTPAQLRVKKGDTVHITLTNDSPMQHDWRLDEFGAKTNIITKGQTGTTTFVASKTGTFEYYCSVGNHRQMGMVGQLIVE